MAKLLPLLQGCKTTDIQWDISSFYLEEKAVHLPKKWSNVFEYCSCLGDLYRSCYRELLLAIPYFPGFFGL